MQSSKINVKHINCYSDNFSYLVQGNDPNNCMLVDPCEFKPIANFLDKQSGIKVSHILCTHKHWDHIGGALQLIPYMKKKYGIAPQVYGGEKESLSFVTNPIGKLTKVKIANVSLTVKPSACHTRGHVLYYMEVDQERKIFTGDTLFIGGCGKFFEGDGQEMSQNFDWIRQLPDDTLIYDGHEYTVGSLTWGAGMDIKDQQLYVDYIHACKKRLSQGLPTHPGSVGQEKKTNIFMKSWLPHIQKVCGTDNVGQCFQYLRNWKNNGKVLKKPNL